MSLSTEIQRLHDAKDAIRSAIVRKGVQVSSLAKLDDYAGYVDQIQAGTLPSGLSQGVWDDWGRIVSFTTKRNVTTIENKAFYAYKSLTSISIPNVTSIGSQALQNCSSLASVSMPNVTSIGNDVFSSCSKLASVSMSNVTSIGNGAFFICSSLASIDIPSGVTHIYSSAFLGCSSLASVICRATTPPFLGSSAFTNTSSNLVIYVPAESVETYKTATNWSTYADKIQAIQS